LNGGTLHRLSIHPDDTASNGSRALGAEGWQGETKHHE
jgi:hypothetical protein